MRPDIDPNIEQLFPHVTHTVSSANSLLVLLHDNIEQNFKSLSWCARTAADAGMRIYFIGAPNPALETMLSTLNISPHKISSLQWETDGLNVTLNENNCILVTVNYFTFLIYLGRRTYQNFRCGVQMSFEQWQVVL
jgi:hypothetical protein